MAKLLYQGHGSIRIVSAKGLVIYVDPYAGTGYDVPADFILVTHEHYDHNKVGIVAKEAGCRIFRAKHFLSGGKYGEVTLDGIRIQAVPAYNKNHKASECVGYLITLENNITIYCAGDTSRTDYMEETLSKQHIDYALLPCDGVYNMDAAEAAHCADIIGACCSIPIHTKPGVLFSPKVAALFDTTSALIMQPGEEIDLLPQTKD
ncbi:MAG TPA: MBL fold metallo-hydrolase [Treponema sp.]|nr:MBL fold metallo-hydrolase [Treponema sp.]